MTAKDAEFVVPRHGVDSWDLVEYSWDPDGGETILLYEHDDGRVVTVTARQEQWASAGPGLK